MTVRLAWPVAIGISLSVHAALLVVGVHTLVVPARVDVAPGRQALPRLRVGLVYEPGPAEPQPALATEPETTAEPEPCVTTVAFESPDEASDQQARPPVRAKGQATCTEESSIVDRREQEAAAGDPLPCTDAEPLTRSNKAPSYPLVARRLGWEGTVVLDVEVRVDGRVASVTVARSSGHGVLDRAATDAVRLWRFEPARHLGTPIACHVPQPVRFQLVSP